MQLGAGGGEEYAISYSNNISVLFFFFFWNVEREIKAFSKKNPKTKQPLQLYLKVFNAFSDLTGVAVKNKRAEGQFTAERASGAQSKTAAPSFGSRK